MDALIVHVAGAAVPVLLCVLAGVGLAKLRVPFDNAMVGGLVAKIGYPTLILSHLSARHIDLAELLGMMLAAAATCACFAAISFVLLRIVGLPVRAYLSPMTFNTVGNIGISVGVLAFGPAGLAYALAFMVVIAIGLFTVAIWLPSRTVSFGGLVRNPVIYAVAIAVALMATDTRLPPIIQSTLDILGGLTIPLLLLTLGHSVATLKVESVRIGLGLAVFHAAMGAGVATALVPLFGFVGLERSVFILLCMMPVSMTTYLWVDQYDPDEAAGVASFIVVSTLLSIVVLPTVLAFWLAPH